MAELKQVIETFDRRGVGSPNDPHRIVKQFWSVTGVLLMEADHWEKSHQSQCNHNAYEAITAVIDILVRFNAPNFADLTPAREAAQVVKRNLEGCPVTLLERVG